MVRVVLQAVAIADSGNHCLRICRLHDTNGKFIYDRMLTFGDRKVPDHADGNSGEALFNTPSGLVACNNGLLICDSGNHCIKYLSLQNGEWKVLTVAGSPKSPGSVDGRALGETRCTFPGHITASVTKNNVFYFIEQSSNPGIREFDANTGTVTTLLRGAPLIAPGSLCATDNDCLLLCDSGACCIWSFDLNNRQLTPKVTAENMYLLNVELYDETDAGEAVAGASKAPRSSAPKDRDAGDSATRIIPPKFVGIGSTAFNDRFCPVGIVRVRPGWFVFGETNTHSSLFRYLEQPVVFEEVERVRAATEVEDAYIFSKVYLTYRSCFTAL
jgi:hypothetical protein